MKKRLLNLFLIFSIIFNFFFFDFPRSVLAACEFVNSDDINVLQRAQEDCQKDREARMPAQNKNKEDLARLEKNLGITKKLIQAIEIQVKNLEKEIFSQEIELEYQKEIFAARVRDYYKKSKGFSAFSLLLTSSSANNLFRELSYRQSAAANDKKIIAEVSLDLKELNDNKTKLEANNLKLNNAKAKLDQDTKVLRVEVEKVEDYFSQINETIAALSARQQEIINARSGGFIASIGDIELADDYSASIKGFRESAPSGYFAVFSFGAFTHRKGMSQYGARGRAQNGQTYDRILEAYYGKKPVKKDTGGDIIVNGAAMNFEDKYLMGIAEMPSSWHMEALKAQAVAARTYAYRYKTQGNSICITEKCQVFNSGKAANPPEAWKQAVQSTRGEVLEDVVTYYASTHGGYATPIGWDTTNGSGGGNFIDNTYDKIGGSPWLYKAWYTQAYSVNSDKCGRSNAWLSSQEMADIVNAAIALKTEGIDISRITPVTTSCWGGNPYSMDELRNLVSGKGGLSSATSVSVSQGNGTTNSVTINGVNLSGAEFKKAFNLRAPGRLSIPQSGFAFYNIEKK
jgi:peptidoglycan hydrolase CwlO-like protein